MKIRSESFLNVLRADLASRGKEIRVKSFVADVVARFHLYLRLVEFLQHTPRVYPLYLLVRFIFHRHSQRLGFSIPPGTIGKGVYLPHYGTIVINSRAWVGDFSTINVGVVIGRHPEEKHSVPTIGKNVYIAPGVCIYGNVSIGDNSKIGANSVVNTDVESGSFFVGSPARKVELAN